MATDRDYMRLALSSLLVIASLSLSGCGEFNILDTPQQIIKKPLGTDAIKVGMTKNQVTSIWGKPDQINKLKASDEWQTPKEEWVYIGRYSKIPLDRSYLFKTKYLIFDGNNVVSIGDETQYKATEKEESLSF